MPITNPDAEKYIQALTPNRREALQQVRQLIFETVPEIKETMQYRMPTYELDEVVCALASQKDYISLYMDVETVGEHCEQFAHLDVGKSCIRFKKIEQLPMNAVKQILLETIQKQAAQ